MLKKASLFFFLLVSSLEAQESDTLLKISPAVTADSLKVDSIVSPSFSWQIIETFSAQNPVTLEELNNSITKNWGDLLKNYTVIETFSEGPLSQSLVPSFFGSNPANLAFLVDGLSLKQQNFSFPQRKDLDLNIFGHENVASIYILPPLATNVLSQDKALGGIFAESKNFTLKPDFSKATAEIGPYGYRRTQVELDKTFFKKYQTYLSGGFKDYSSYLPFSKGESFFLNTKIQNQVVRKGKFVKQEFTFFYNERNTDLLLFPELLYQQGKKKENLWGLSFFQQMGKKDQIRWEFRYSYFQDYQKNRDNFYDYNLERKETHIQSEVTFFSNLWEKQLLRFKLQMQAKYRQPKNQLITIERNLLSMTDFINLGRSSLLFYAGVDDHNDYTRKFDIGVGIERVLSADMKVFTSWGNFNTYPTIQDRFQDALFLSLDDSQSGQATYAESGNSNLKATKILFWDFALQITKPVYNAGFYFLLSRIKNEIWWQKGTSSLTFGDWSPVNKDTDYRGLNFYLDARLLSNFRFYISYNLKDSKEKETDKFLDFGSRHNLYSYIEYTTLLRNQGFRLNLRLEEQFRGERFSPDFNTNLKSIFLSNARLGLKLYDLTFYLVLENFTNQTYFLRGEYHQPKRTFWWGFSWQFFD